MSRIIRRLWRRTPAWHLAIAAPERPLHPWFVSRDLHLVESGVRYR